MAKKHEVTEKIKKKIIAYCDYVFTQHIDKKDLDKYKVPHSYFLELLYRTCVDEYEHEGSIELYESRINEIIAILQQSEKIFDSFKDKKVQLVGIDEAGLLHFNNNLNNKLKYNKKLKEWEIEEKDDPQQTEDNG